MDKTLKAAAILGKDAEKWFQSELGRLVVGRAQQEIDDAYNDFRTILPSDSSAIERIQNKILVAEKAIIWLNEALVMGRNALQSLDYQQELEQGE